MKKAKKLLALLLALIISLSASTVAFATTELSEKESNATPESANLIGVGGSISAKLDTSEDVDWFTFTSDGFGLAEVSFSHNTVSNTDSNVSFFKVEIVGEDGVYIDSFKSAGNQALAAVKFSVVPGKYFIKVAMDRQYIANLDYSVKVTLDKSANVEKEDNDTLGDATEMKTATPTNKTISYYGTIDKGTEAGGDKDYFVFEVKEAAFITPSIENTASDIGKCKLTVIDVATGKDGKADERVLGSITIDTNETKVVGGLIGVAAGKYYVKVETLDSNSVGSYNFKIYASPAAYNEIEYNNTPADANTIRIGSKLLGHLFDETDVDVYAFETKGNNSGYKVLLMDNDGKASNPAGQWSVVIKNANGNQIAKTDVLQSKAGELTTPALPEGEYFVYVSKGNVFTGDCYQLEFSALPKADAPADEDDNDSLSFVERITAFFDRFKNLPWMDFFSPILDIVTNINLLGMITDLSGPIIKFFTEFVFKST